MSARRPFKARLSGLAAWLPSMEESASFWGASGRLSYRLNRALYPAGEPTDAEVRKRVATIVRGLGLKCRRPRKRTAKGDRLATPEDIVRGMEWLGRRLEKLRDRPHPMMAMVAKAAKKTRGGPYVVRLTP